ncbi:MAG: carotenoid biosynthesis protein [Candidatus Hermodarchaeota archaeon]
MGLFTLYVELTAFVLFLAIVLFLGLRKKDYRAVMQILSSSLFGVTLEYMNVRVAETYSYSTQFFIQFGNAPGNIPIVIGLSWGLIIYACMQVSDQIGLPEWSRAFLDGLLGLTIDLSMDTIAIRLDGGFWTWTDIPLEPLPTLNSFFGVNYGNLTGWFYVVAIFSILLRFERTILQDQEKFQFSKIITLAYFCIIPFFAYFSLLLAFSISTLPIAWIFGYTPGINGSNQLPQWIALLIFSVVLLLAIITQIVAIFQSRPKIEKDVNWISIVVFMNLHLTYLGFYLLAGIFWEAPLILVLGISMLVIDVFIHWMILDVKRLREQIRGEK